MCSRSSDTVSGQRCACGCEVRSSARPSGLAALRTRARSPERCPQPPLPSSVRALSYSHTVNTERVHGTGGGPQSITSNAGRCRSWRFARPVTASRSRPAFMVARASRPVVDVAASVPGGGSLERRDTRVRDCPWLRKRVCRYPVPARRWGRAGRRERAARHGGVAAGRGDRPALSPPRSRLRLSANHSLGVALLPPRT